MKLPFMNNDYAKKLLYLLTAVTAVTAVIGIIWNIKYIYMGLCVILDLVTKSIAPVFIAFIISYILEPVVGFFENLWKHISLSCFRKEYNNKSRRAGTTITYTLIGLFVGVGIFYAAFKAGNTDAKKISDSINGYIEGFGDLLVLFQVNMAQIGLLQYDAFYDAVMEIITGFTDKATMYVTNMFSSVTVIGGVILNIGLGFVTAFYFLMEKDKLLYNLNDALVVFAGKKAEKIQDVGRDINNIFRCYIGGQLTDAFIVGGLFTAAFCIIGIKYPVIIGILAGIGNLIPYIGSIVALVLAVIMAFSAGSFVKVILVLGAAFTIQQIDSMFIIPKVVGKSVSLKPLTVLISLTVFGRLFGFIGLLIAVPLAAVIKLFFKRYYEKKKYGQYKSLI